MTKEAIGNRKSRYKYPDTNITICEGDAVVAYGAALYNPEGENGFISYEDDRWYFESPSAKMGYFLKDVLDEGRVVKNNGLDDFKIINP